MGRTLELVNRLNPTSRLAGFECGGLDAEMHLCITSGEVPVTVLRRTNCNKTIVSTYPVQLYRTHTHSGLLSHKSIVSTRSLLYPANAICC